MQKVIISIINYNNTQDTLDCLNSLMSVEHEGFEIETYVLDNGSKEVFEIDWSDYSKISLTVIRNNENLGFTGGHNLIYEKVQNKQFDFFLILNNDILMDKKCLNYLTSSMKDERVGAAVPKIYFTKGKEFHKDKYNEDERGRVFWYAGGNIDWDNVQSKHRGVDEVDRGQYDKLEIIDFATGACLLLKKEIIKKVGLFDKKYFLYFEDADLSQRIIKAGYKIVYEPKAIIWHNNAGSSGSGSLLHDYYLTRNRLLFGMKYASFKMKMHLILESVRLFLFGRKWQKKGIYDFYTWKFGRGSFKP